MNSKMFRLKTKRITIRLDPQLYNLTMKLAKDLNVSVSDLVRRSLITYAVFVEIGQLLSLFAGPGYDPIDIDRRLNILVSILNCRQNS